MVWGLTPHQIHSLVGCSSAIVMFRQLRLKVPSFHVDEPVRARLSIGAENSTPNSASSTCLFANWLKSFRISAHDFSTPRTGRDHGSARRRAPGVHLDPVAVEDCMLARKRPLWMRRTATPSREVGRCFGTFPASTNTRKDAFRGSASLLPIAIPTTDGSSMTSLSYLRCTSIT